MFDDIRHIFGQFFPTIQFFHVAQIINLCVSDDLFQIGRKLGSSFSCTK